MSAQQPLPVSSDGWTLSQEREFLENLLVQRFNFMLVFAAFVGAGFAASTDRLVGALLLYLGAVVSFLLQLTLERAQAKFEVILARLKLDPTHPIAWVDAQMASRPGRSRNALIGRWIPRVLTSALAAAAVIDTIVLIVD